MEWIKVEDNLPSEGVPVLTHLNGHDYPVILERVWEYPTYEENFKPFWYWRDSTCDSLLIEDNSDVSAWMPLPELENE